MLETIRYNIPAGKAEMPPYKVILWGWRRQYLYGLNSILHFVENGQIEVLGVTGNTLPPYRTLDGFAVMTPQEAAQAGADYLIIFSEANQAEIRTDAMELGFTREQILPGKIFQVPYFDFRRYIAVKNRRISVLSNDCFGGYLSNALGLMHRSPFKNMYLKDRHYLACLRNLRHYCTEETPVFSRWQDGNSKGDCPRYPVLDLGDLEIYCNHDSDPDEAIEKWLRRRALLNYEDLFVEIRTTRRDTEEEFNELEQFPNRICFVPYETEKPYSLQVLPPASDIPWAEAVHGNVILGGRNLLFSMIDLLAGERGCLRAEK